MFEVPFNGIPGCRHGSAFCSRKFRMSHLLKYSLRPLDDSDIEDFHSSYRLKVGS